MSGEEGCVLNGDILCLGDAMAIPRTGLSVPPMEYTSTIELTIDSTAVEELDEFIVP